MGLFGPSVGHPALYEEICRYHDLDKKIKKLLDAVVKKYQMPRPAEIFIVPETLRRAMEEAASDDEKNDLRKLYETWFQE
ncbi:MAG: hypothetical protein LBH00_00750 [Planctomycetaceae bacterium]|jgi:hypothetical protein|nr:hypothetical protein [Planctomycetaceae bacterium]